MTQHDLRPRGARLLVVIIGPSGSGKSSLVRELHRRGHVAVRPTVTTRPRRPDERAGSIEHRFVTDDEFDELDRAGAFLGTTTMFGLPHRYGLPIDPAPAGRRAEVLMLRTKVLGAFVELVARPDLIVQVEADPQSIRARLVARGCGEAELLARLADNEHEVRLGRAHADLVVRNDGSVVELADRVADTLDSLTVAVAA